MSFLHYEDVSYSYKDYKFKMDIKIDFTSVTVCIKCFGEICLPSQDQCVLRITVKRSDNGKIAVMSDFYNDLIKDTKDTSAISPKLKGAIYAVLCILLHSATEKGILKSEDLVMIQNASKNDISYYANIGFTYDQKKRLFVGKVQDIMQTCISKRNHISEELRHIMSAV